MRVMTRFNNAAGAGQPTRLVVALAGSFIVFAMLLTSVGPVSRQSMARFGVDRPQANYLELFKDLPIAATSFLIASFLPLLGYRRGLMIAHAMVAGACVLMPLLPAFATSAVLFACVGVAFAVAKVSVYGAIGLLTRDKA